MRAFRPDAGQVRECVDQSLDGAVIGQCHGSPFLGFRKIRSCFREIRDCAALIVEILLLLHVARVFGVVGAEILDFFHFEQSCQIIHA